MNIGEFFKDKMIVILLNVLVFIILAGILLTANVQFIIIFFVFCIWFFPLISYMAIEFIRCKNYYNEING
ncbi:histidine kinase, partial [Bacillus toyonensis]